MDMGDPRGIENDIVARDENDLLALAQPLSAKLRLETIFMSECNASRTPQADTETPGIVLKIDVVDTTYHTNIDLKRFLVAPKFRLTTSKVGDDKSPDVTIECRFVILYTFEDFSNINDNNMRAFSRTNAIFNAWPYLREYVQSTSMRMGLKAITLDLYRL